MKKYNIKDFKLGWLIGNFEPSIVKTKKFEIGIKKYRTGDYEKPHLHKKSDEITIIIDGKVLMNGEEYKENDIILIEKGVCTDFKAITDTTTAVIKIPSLPGDKFVIEN
jgi:mannose-6-phosphate isomerase-like protein (cupin superfamily)